jgi:ribosome-associated protein
MAKKKIIAPVAVAALAPEVDETGVKLARQCVWAAQDKKAMDPIILDLRTISSITDYMVICSAQSEPQLKAIANGVEQAVKETLERHPLAVDGFPTSQWIVIDYGDVMLHIFHDQKRGVYALEDLWSDAPQVSTLAPK